MIAPIIEVRMCLIFFVIYNYMELLLSIVIHYYYEYGHPGTVGDNQCWFSYALVFTLIRVGTWRESPVFHVW